jgi:hypothetical protein
MNWSDLPNELIITVAATDSDVWRQLRHLCQLHHTLLPWSAYVRTFTVVYVDRTGYEWTLDDKLHREDGPARVTAARREWYRYGQLHRDHDLPAVVASDGGREWWVRDQCHRSGGRPAATGSGSSRWLAGGVWHRGADKPAIIWWSAQREWWIQGRLQRDDDRPDIIQADGAQLWHDANGMLHRDGDKPASVDVDGSRRWYKNGVPSREGDKPAIVLDDGYRAWGRRKNARRHRKATHSCMMTQNGMRWLYSDGRDIILPSHGW